MVGGGLGLSELNRDSRLDTGLRGHPPSSPHPPPSTFTSTATTPPTTPPVPALMVETLRSSPTLFPVPGGLATGASPLPVGDVFVFRAVVDVPGEEEIRRVPSPAKRGSEREKYHLPGALISAYSGVCGMGVQYICDAEGRKTGVIVPIGLWDSLNAEKPVGERVGVPDPGKYRGIYRNLNVDLKAEIRNLRDEWNRI